MSQIHAAITGVQGWVPDNVLSNKDLEQMVDTNDEWIKTRTGIEERRILKREGAATSYMATKVLEGLLEKTNTKAEEIDLLIMGTVTEDYRFPDTANIVLHNVGATNAFGYDIHAACSGFLFSLVTGAQFIASGMYKKVVVIGADMMSSIVDYSDRATCILFGDGAGGVLLEPDTDGHGLIDAELKSDGSGGKYLHMKAGGSAHPASIETVKNGMHFAYQEGRPVFKAAIHGMSSAIKTVLDRQGFTNDDIQWVVPHQANLRIIQSVAKALDFPMEKVMVNIQKYGNTTAATIPLCLWEWENTLKKGENIVLTSFGGGFTWGSILLKWAYSKTTN
jgi:3-oxoacyl-[acyl-carrier-protein] synthase-3